jgi:hypothetical protein
MPGDPPRVRAITRGPKFHWFAYYDKLQFDPTGRYCLGMEVDFEHRPPTAHGVIKVGMIDLKEGDRWTELGESRSWCWQQGCMLQWLPGSKSEVIWNDRDGDHFACHVLDVVTLKRRTIPNPIYTVSPDARIAVAPDFRRINYCRPGYGYPGLADPWRDDPAPKDAGIWRVDLATGRQDLIISLAQIADIPYAPGYPPNATHWFNHLLFNPDGSRFIFLHRWRGKGAKGFATRMFTASPDGKDIHCVVDSGMASHFIWRDPTHILVWATHRSHGTCFCLFEDRTGNAEPVGKGVMTQDGHCSYLPDGSWIVNDSYPDRERKRQVYLYHVPTGKKAEIGRFYAAPQYEGEWRCDTHPRFSPDGRALCIDSPHEGHGRQLYLIDIGDVLDHPPKAD